MNDEGHNVASAAAVEDMLRRELAGGDILATSTRPILRHLLANRDDSLFNDEVIARIRGMITHIARQLLIARGQAAGITDLGKFADDRQAELAQLLFADAAFLSHAHSVTLEAQTAQALSRRSGIDCVLSPLLQDMTASSDADVASCAMRAVAAQARFIQHHRRMELPIGELPAELFHKAMLLMRGQAGQNDAAEKAVAQLREKYDESGSRLGQFAQLVMGPGKTLPKILAIEHAGLALFATALAMSSKQTWESVILSLGQNQQARLAVSLRAAGLGTADLEQQFLNIHPGLTPPQGLDALEIHAAAQILADMRSEAKR